VPHAEREDASTSIYPAGAPQRRAVTGLSIPDAHVNHMGDEHEALWPGVGDALHSHG
jgi:hypothetical protein